MPKFTLEDNITEVSSANMNLDKERDFKRLRVHDVGADKKALQITSTDVKVVKGVLGSLFDGPKGIWTVEIYAKGKGKANIEAKLKAVVVATFAVTVLDPMTLPGAAGEEGLLVRLLLAENLTPDEAGYNTADSRKSMQWMRVVLANRLKNNPAQFAAPNAKSITDIVKAQGQFAGFEKYPTLNADHAARIAKIVKIANDDNDKRKEQYMKFLQDALDVAKEQLITDPCSTGLYGWRKVNSDPPGGNLVAYDSPLSGNQFYTLNPK